MLDFTIFPIFPNLGRSHVRDCIFGIYWPSIKDYLTESGLTKSPRPFHPFLVIIVSLKYYFSAVSTFSSYSEEFLFLGVEITLWLGDLLKTLILSMFLGMFKTFYVLNGLTELEFVSFNLDYVLVLFDWR